MKKIFLWPLFLCTCMAFTQSKTIGELRGVLLQGQSDGKKARLQYELADLYRKNLQVDSAYFFATRNWDYQKGKGPDSLRVKSLLQLYRLQHTTIKKDSTDYFALAQQIAQHSPNKALLIETVYAQGQVLYLNNEWALAFPAFLEVARLSKKYNIKNKTTVYAIIQRSEIIRQKFTEATTLEAEQLLHEALQMAREINSPEMANLIYTYLADTSELQEKHAESKRYIDLAYAYYLKKDDIRNLSQIYLLYTSYYIGMDDIPNANKMQLKRIEYLRTKEDRLELARALAYYGSFQRRKTKQYKEAITNLLEAKAIYESINLDDIDAFERLIFNLSRCYSELQQHEQANIYLKDAYNLREKLIARENRNLTSSLETRFQTEKKEQEIALLSQLARKQNYIYLSIVGLLLVLATALFLIYRNKIRTAQKLKELSALKSRFFANISHEFRTPLTLIKSPVQSLSDELQEERQQKKLKLIDKNADRMLELVDQLLALSKIDNGKLQLLLKEGNIGSFLGLLAEPFEFMASENQIGFSTSIQKTTESHLFDKDVIQKIVTNLLSNAFKYTAENESIAFEASMKENLLKIVVSNPAKQIKTTDLPKLFERFYQENEDQPGVGIGLALVRELVGLYNGKITAAVNNGVLSFLVELPLEKNQNSVVANKAIPAEIDNPSTDSENELPILLIVDDNDQIRTVVKDLFSANYKVLQADDGKKALKLAQKEIPDCIISDVMMPQLDGYQFTSAIKNNELTSFIPVILLTAKTAEEAHLEGIKSQADAFLTKPFHNEILKQTVRQLISERQKLQQRYSKELVLKPADIVINSVDEKFLEKLQLVLDKQLANADYPADEFAADMGMSRMQLHRKLKSLLGVSATEFLRKERIKVAAGLLKAGNGTVSEIAYSVGFNDVSYFIRCFREVYHCTPSEFLQDK